MDAGVDTLGRVSSPQTSHKPTDGHQAPRMAPSGDSSAGDGRPPAELEPFHMWAHQLTYWRRILAVMQRSRRSPWYVDYDALG